MELKIFKERVEKVAVGKTKASLEMREEDDPLTGLEYWS